VWGVIGHWLRPSQHVQRRSMPRCSHACCSRVPMLCDIGPLWHSSDHVGVTQHNRQAGIACPATANGMPHLSSFFLLQFSGFRFTMLCPCRCLGPITSHQPAQQQHQRWQHIPCLEQQEQPLGQPWWVTTLDPTRRWVDMKGGLSKSDRSVDVAFSRVLCLLTEYLVTDRHSTGHSTRKSWVHMLV
jgi:hypothetical protein